MSEAQTVSKSDALAGRFVPNEPTADLAEADVYEGVNLAPTTLESLVTWDVSLHARREQERLRQAAARIPAATPDLD